MEPLADSDSRVDSNTTFEANDASLSTDVRPYQLLVSCGRSWFCFLTLHSADAVAVGCSDLLEELIVKAYLLILSGAH